MFGLPKHANYFVLNHLFTPYCTLDALILLVTLILYAFGSEIWCATFSHFGNLSGEYVGNETPHCKAIPAANR